MLMRRRVRHLLRRWAAALARPRRHRPAPGGQPSTEPHGVRLARRSVLEDIGTRAHRGRSRM